MLPLLLACVPPASDPDSAAPSVPDGPDLVVDSELVDFGAVRLGQEAAATLTLSNAGDLPLTLDAPILADPTAPFLVADLPATELLPGEALSLALTFVADPAGEHATRLLLPTDDPDASLTEVILVGTATTPIVAFEPTTIDFGAIEAACVDVTEVVVRNDGDADLAVTSFDVTGGDGTFAVDPDEATNGPLPWTVAPGDTRTLWVSFAPVREAHHAGGIVVETDDPANPNAAITLDGDGLDNDRITDTFATLGQPLDLLFAVGGVDADELSASLVDALPSLTAPLVAANVDFQVGAVRADDGCLLNGLLVTGSMTEAEQADALEGLLAGSGTAHTLSLLEAAVGGMYGGGCNDDLARPSAGLVLVGLTDSAAAAPQAPGVYSSAFEAAKEDPDDVAAWLIGPDGGACGDADTAWTAVTASTGGTSLSVCDDLATNLETLAEATLRRQDEFPLSRIPWTDTLTVSVDGEATSGWTYDGESNALVFDPESAPPIGAFVRVFYDAVPECGER